MSADGDISAPHEVVIVRRRGGEADDGHHGGAWKIAFADLMTAMMAFFLVMWITGQSQDTKQAISGYFRDPWGTSSEHSMPTSILPSETQGDTLNVDIPKRSPPGAKPGSADVKGQNEDQRSKSRWAQKRKVHFVEEEDKATPALVLRFDESSAELTDQSKEQIDRLIPTLVGKVNKIEIRGHSTRRPLPEGSPYKNIWDLCFARAQSVMDYLASNGIEPERIRLSQSAANERLTSRVEAAWQTENSRVEVFLLNELIDTLPGTQGGDAAKAALAGADPDSGS